jgi:hypothetical protein
VLGAIVFDRAGLRSAFLLQTAVNVIPLLLALLVVPLWAFAGTQSSSCSVNAHCSDSSLEDPLQVLPTVNRDESYSSSCNDTSNAEMLAIGFELKDVTAGGGFLQKPPTYVQQSAVGSKQFVAAEDTAEFVCIEVSCDDTSDIHQQKDNWRYLHIDSARDLESMRIAAAAAAKQDSADSETGSEVESTDNDTKFAASNRQQQQQQQQQVPATPQSDSLGIRSVLSTVPVPVVFSQCLLVFLEALATGMVVVLVPAAMDVPTWLVGVTLIAMVSCLPSHGMMSVQNGQALYSSNGVL